MTARAALGVGGAMRESEGFITQAVGDFWAESCYDYVSTKNKNETLVTSRFLSIMT